MPCTRQKAVFKLLHKIQQRETGTHDYLYELEYSEEDLKHIEDEVAAVAAAERQALPVGKDEGPLLIWAWLELTKIKLFVVCLPARVLFH